MKNIDYIIVGGGIAGISMAKRILDNKKTFILFDNNSLQTTKIAGGMCNPLIFKRYTSIWNSSNIMNESYDFYKKFDELLNTNCLKQLEMVRIFSSKKEPDNFILASDKPSLSQYLKNTISKDNKYSSRLNTPYGIGETNDVMRVDLKLLQENFYKYLHDNNLIITKEFDYSKIKFNKNESISYKEINCKKIIFCEGYNIYKNPFFNYLPLKPTKGEILIINSPELKLDKLVKSSVFILPLGNDNYIVGATYNWEKMNEISTTKAKNELLDKLEKIIKVQYSVVNHFAGIRPTTKDRKPFVGIHPKHKNLVTLNGLGTRGALNGAYLSRELIELLENKKTLNKEIDINRFL